MWQQPNGCAVSDKRGNVESGKITYIVSSRLKIEADGPEEASRLATEMWARGDHDEIRTAALNAQTATEALEFYANPESYWAIFIVPDRPAGLFADDVGCVLLDDEHDHRHGRRARQALGNEWWDTEPCEEQLAVDQQLGREGD